MDEMFVNTKLVSIRPISHNVAREWIRKKHYTNCLNGCRYALGVYYAESNPDSFFDVGERLIGVIVYAHPVSNKAIDSICGPNTLGLDEVLELIRLHIDDLPNCKNIESFVIGQSFEWLRQNDSRVKVLISYADPEVGHTGRIYRATNWLYQGCGISKLMPDYSIKLTENGEWIHSRSVGSRFGNKNVKSLAKRIGHTFWRKEETAKHRYIYFLTDKKETKRLKKLLKLPILPYSEIKQLDQLIQKVVVKDGEYSHVETVQGSGDGSFKLKGEWRPEEWTSHSSS
jgi:hypothetical protein